MSEIGPRLTVAIVPRERWSLAIKTLDQTIATIPDGTNLVYVDGGSPDDVADGLRSRVEEYGGTYVRRDCVLTPHESRNLILPHLAGDYVIIKDDDVWPKEGWADALVRSADESGAGMVGPTILHGKDEHAAQIHFGGSVIKVNDHNVMETNKHLHNYVNLVDLKAPLERAESDQLEAHCLLIRRDTLEAIAPFDEEIATVGGHEDVAMKVKATGRNIIVEPSAQVIYLLMAKVDRSDWSYWQLRWCWGWTHDSLDAFCDKWDIARDEGWPSWAEPWTLKQRSWMYQEQGPILTYYGKALRFASRRYKTARVAAAFDEAMHRGARKERRRREAALGHA